MDKEPIPSSSGFNEDANNLLKPLNDPFEVITYGKFNLKGSSMNSSIPSEVIGITPMQQRSLGIFNMKHLEKNSISSNNNPPSLDNSSQQDLEQQSEKTAKQQNQFQQLCGGFKGITGVNPLSSLTFQRDRTAAAPSIKPPNTSSAKAPPQLLLNGLNKMFNQASAAQILQPLFDVGNTETASNPLNTAVEAHQNQVQSSSSPPHSVQHSRICTQIPNSKNLCSSEPVTRVSSSSSSSRPTKRGTTIIIPVPSNASEANQFGPIDSQQFQQFQCLFPSDSNNNNNWNNSNGAVGNNNTLNQINSQNNSFNFNGQFQQYSSLNNNKPLNLSLSHQNSRPQFNFSPFPSNLMFNQFANDNSSLDNNNDVNQLGFQPKSSYGNSLFKMVNSFNDMQRQDSFFQRNSSQRAQLFDNSIFNNNEDRDLDNTINISSNNELPADNMFQLMKQLFMKDLAQKNAEEKCKAGENEEKDEHHMLPDDASRQLKEEEGDEEAQNDNSIVSSNFAGAYQEKQQKKQNTKNSNNNHFSLQNNDSEEHFASKYSKNTGTIVNMNNPSENYMLNNNKQTYEGDYNFNNSTIKPFQANIQENLEYSEKHMNNGTQDGSKKTSSSRQSQHKNVYKNFGKELLRYVRAKRQECVDLNHDEFEYLLDCLTGGLNDKDTKQTLPVQKKEQLQQLWTLKPQEGNCSANKSRNSTQPTKKQKLDTQSDGQQQENASNNTAENILANQEDDNIHEDDSLDVKVKKTFRQLSWEFFDHWAFQYVMNSRKLDKKEIHLKCIPSFLYGILMPKSLEAFKPIRETHQQQQQKRQQELQNQAEQEQQHQMKIKIKKEI